MSMKGGRENKGFGGGSGGPPADLLVCFPSRARLALMPKPICSPVRPNSEPNKRPHLKKINTTRGRAGGGPPSPLLWSGPKGKQMTSTGGDLAEPTSPKVTCAGQIKVRPRSSGGGAATCRNWQSVMEEIERLHNSNRSKHNNDKIAANKNGKKSKYWGEALGFKKEIVSFLTCLGNIRFDFRCFGSFPHQDISSDDEEDDDDEEEEEQEEEDEEEEEEDQRNNAVFSKWFMVLQENQDKVNHSNNDAITTTTPTIDDNDENEDPECEPQVQVPPPNALLLMRCRSAPAVKRFNDPTQIQSATRTTFNVGPTNCDAGTHDNNQKKAEEEAVSCIEKPKKKRRESLAIVMKYDTDFYDLSPEVCKETWLVGDLRDALNLSRSRSCKR